MMKPCMEAFDWLNVHESWLVIGWRPAVARVPVAWERLESGMIHIQS